MKEIYIVEDDEGIRELVEFLLISRDYATQAFPNVKKFEEQMAVQTPDLILLDVMLPDGNGLEVCKNLCKDDRTSQIPIVLMSAHAHPDLSKGSCARDYITKPFDVDDFLQRLENLL